MMQKGDGDSRLERRPVASRAAIGLLPGLTWVPTFVLKAACEAALHLSDRRLTLDQVEERLAAPTRISRQQIEDALDSLCERGYLIADDAPLNPEIVIQVTRTGLEACCSHLMESYDTVRHTIFQLVCQDAALDVAALAYRVGQPELLVKHILEIAETHGLLRLARTGHYIVIQEVRPQLRRWISGAA